MSSITAAIGGLKAASDIAKSLVDIRDVAVIQQKTIELQSAILAAQSSALTAQSEQSDLLNRVRDLEKEVARVKAWEAEKERYELNEVVPRCFTYTLKEHTKAAEPSHHICANCCDVHHQKSILQEVTFNTYRATALECPNCGARIYTQGMRSKEHK